jgi:hypothetical protein
LGYHQIAMKESDQLMTSFHHPIRHVLLRHHAVWPEKCWRHPPALHAEMFCGSDQSILAAQLARAAETHSRRLHGRCCGESA